MEIPEKEPKDFMTFKSQGEKRIPISVIEVNALLQRYR